LPSLHRPTAVQASEFCMSNRGRWVALGGLRKAAFATKSNRHVSQKLVSKIRVGHIDRTQIVNCVRTNHPGDLRSLVNRVRTFPRPHVKPLCSRGFKEALRKRANNTARRPHLRTRTTFCKPR
jgi:hypothetical protein